jgi:hypothetical protein
MRAQMSGQLLMLLIAALITVAAGLLAEPPEGQGLVASWSFSQADGPFARNSVSGSEAQIQGAYKYVPGIVGTGLRFDGYTTGVSCKAAEAPRLKSGFTITAWVALNTYPWNWVPVVDQEDSEQAGYFFGIDAFGHVGLQLAIGGAWEELTSTERLPLKRWVHIAATYEAHRGLAIYIDGEEAGRLPVDGEMNEANGVDLLIGRVRRPALPVPAGAIHPKYPVWYSLDGILDELKIYGSSQSSEQVQQAYDAVKAPKEDILPWAKMPSGPPGAGRFGAYYCTLEFQDTWDRLRRIGPDSDVVVRFDEAPIRLVFWQGTNYIPAWVTENDKWYTDEFLETWGEGCPDGGDCEPMSDKQERYSHVTILESDNARAIIHWRYALSEVEHYKGAWPDPLTGWFDWADEYWTVYPDGIAVRKQILWSTRLDKAHEWQETIVLNQPGTRPEDNINLDALTLENMQGETATYSWRPKPGNAFQKPNGPQSADRPQNPNIQIVNLKSIWKPFQIVSPDHSHFNIYNGEKTYFTFECWNHWPVAQILSSGRPCLAPDRASHSSLSHVYWKTYSKTRDSMTKILLDGLTSESPAALLVLAKSWLSPPQMEISGEGYVSQGYDPTQRAFIVLHKPGSHLSRLEVRWAASTASPIFDPALMVKNWGEDTAVLTINGKTEVWGRNYRYGVLQRLGGADLIVWMRQQSDTPVAISLAPR